MESIQITAHRGSSARAPENSLSAFRQAVSDRADWIELDVQTCREGTVVVLHDLNLARVGNDRRRVDEMTFDQIRRIDIGSPFSSRFAGEKVPALREVITELRDQVRLNIELKYFRPDPNLVPAVVEVLRQERFMAHCIISSQNKAALDDFRSLLPGTPTGLIANNTIGNLEEVKEEFLSVAASTVSAHLVNRAHQATKQVHVWTVNEPESMLQMIACGVDNIITDQPAVLRRILDAQHERSNRGG